MSAVHGSPSSQLAPETQLPCPSHASGAVQSEPSAHRVPAGSATPFALQGQEEGSSGWTQPRPASHASAVHGFPSSQSTGTVAAHAPAEHAPYVHRSAKHAAPSGTGSSVQPALGSQRPATQSSGRSHAASSGTYRQP